MNEVDKTKEFSVKVKNASRLSLSFAYMLILGGAAFLVWFSYAATFITAMYRYRGNLELITPPEETFYIECFGRICACAYLLVVVVSLIQILRKKIGVYFIATNVFFAAVLPLVTCCLSIIFMLMAALEVQRESYRCWRKEALTETSRSVDAANQLDSAERGGALAEEGNFNF